MVEDDEADAAEVRHGGADPGEAEHDQQHQRRHQQRHLVPDALNQRHRDAETTLLTCRDAAAGDVTFGRRRRRCLQVKHAFREMIRTPWLSVCLTLSPSQTNQAGVHPQRKVTQRLSTRGGDIPLESSTERTQRTSQSQTRLQFSLQGFYLRYRLVSDLNTADQVDIDLDLPLTRTPKQIDISFAMKAFTDVESHEY